MMRDPALRATSVPSWTRLFYTPIQGFVSVAGDCESVLGVRADRLIGRSDALSQLPPAIADLVSGSPLRGVPVILKGEGLTGTVCPRDDGIEIFLYRIEEYDAQDEELLEDVSAGVTLIDSRGICRFWNGAMTSLFGIRREEAIGKSFSDFMPEPVLLSWDSVIESAFRGRQMRVECRPGRETRIEGSFATTGRGVVATFVDTTDSFRTEKRLRTNRRMTQTYFRSVDTGLVLFGRDYRILLSNPGFGRMFGVAENLMGMAVYEILPKECFEELEKQLPAVLSGAESREPKAGTPVQYTHPDGSGRTVRITLRPLEGEEPEVSYVAGILEDITEMVSLGSRLSREQERSFLLDGLLGREHSGDPAELDRGIADAAVRGIPARAAAIYRYDPYESTYLSAFAGDWPGGLGKEFSELGLPDTVWTSVPCSVLREHETGLLQGSFSECVAYPIGLGNLTAGFLVVCDALDREDQDSMGSFCLSLVHLALLEESLRRQRSGHEQTEFLYRKQSDFLTDLLGGLEVPVAGLTADWKPVLWNSALSDLTGCSGETALERPEIARDVLFGSAGGLSGARSILRDGERTGEPAVWSLPCHAGSGQDRETAESVSFRWKVFSPKIPVAGLVDVSKVLVGVPLEAGDSSSSLESAVRRLETLVNGLFRLSGQSDPRAIAATAAETIRRISGATWIELELLPRGGNGEDSVSIADEPDEDEQESGIDEAVVTMEIASGGRAVAVCRLRGGEWMGLLDSFARVVADRLRQVRERRFLDGALELASAPASSTIVTRSSGEVVIPPAHGRIAGLLREGVDIRSVFANGKSLGDAIARACANGRALTSIDTGGIPGGIPHLIVSLSSEAGGAALLFWMPIEAPTPALAADIDPGSATRGLQTAMAGVLRTAAADVAARLTSLMERLPADRVLHASASSIHHEQVGMSRLAGYLWAFLRSQLGVSCPADPVEVLRQVSDSFVACGSMAPGVTHAIDLPVPGIDERLLAFIIGRLAEMASKGGQCAISAIALPPGSDELRDAILPPSTSPFLSICVESGSPFPDSAGASGLLSDLEAGMLSRRGELSLLQLIVVLSGGDCVQSEDRKRLSVILPGEAGSREDQDEPSSGLSVLIIDEDVSSRHLLARALRKQDCEVIQASDGVEGLRLVRDRKGEVDAVFISQQLHGLGGMETLLELRSARPGLPAGLIVPVGSTGTGGGAAAGEFVTILKRPFGSLEATEAAREMTAMIRGSARSGELEDRTRE